MLPFICLKTVPWLSPTTLQFFHFVFKCGEFDSGPAVSTVMLDTFAMAELHLRPGSETKLSRCLVEVFDPYKKSYIALLLGRVPHALLERILPARGQLE